MPGSSRRRISWLPFQTPELADDGRAQLDHALDLGSRVFPAQRKPHGRLHVAAIDPHGRQHVGDLDLGRRTGRAARYTHALEIEIDDDAFPLDPAKAEIERVAQTDRKSVV